MEITDLIDLADKHLPQLKDANGVVSVIQPIDQGADEILREARVGPIKYNPLHIEPLLDEAFEHLMRCLDLRNVGQSMEERAVMDILGFENLFNSIKLEEEKLKVSKNFSGKSKMISKQSALHRSSSQYLGTEESIREVREFEEDVLENDQKSLELLKKFNSNLKELREIEGSALNLAERFENIKEQFVIEIQQAYIKLRSVSLGLKEVYGLDGFELPSISQVRYIDELYFYAKKVNVRLDELLQYEQEILISIPLRHGYYKGSEHIKVYSDDATFIAQRNAGELNFKLPSELFSDFKNVKLRGLKCSVRWDKAVQSSDRWNFRVTLPKQKDTQGNTIWEIPDYHTVGLMANNPGYIYSATRDLSIYNASIEGEWSIRLPTKSSRLTAMNGANMNDIWLELLISARTI